MFGTAHEVKVVATEWGVEILVSGNKVAGFSNADRRLHLFQIDGNLTGLETNGLTVVTQVG